MAVLATLRPIGQGLVSAQDRSMTNAINRACVVLMCAHLEGYLEDLAEDVVDCLLRNATSPTHIPLAMRFLLFAAAAETILSRRKEMMQTGDLSQLEAFFRDHGPLWGGTWKPPAGVLDAAVSKEQLSNPMSDQIRQFMNTLGVADAFRPIKGSSSNLSPQSLRATIDDLVRKRHAIAHGEATTADSLPTSEDVNRYFEAVMRFALRVEHQCTEQLQPICAPGAVW